MTPTTLPDPVLPETWAKVGKTADGLRVRINPATGNHCVVDPVKPGRLYSVVVWPAIRRERAERVALDMLAELRRDLAFAREVARYLEATRDTGGVLYTSTTIRIAGIEAAIAKAEGRS